MLSPLTPSHSVVIFPDYWKKGEVRNAYLKLRIKLVWIILSHYRPVQSLLTFTLRELIQKYPES